MQRQRPAITRWIILGLILRGVSSASESMGDRAVLIGDDRGEALFWHLLALIFLIGFAACGIKILWNLVRHWRGTGVPASVAHVFAEAAQPQVSSDFDADAALARYQARKATAQDVQTPATPPPGSFGRKGL